MNDLINKINLRFESGNSVPVDSVRITREEWYSLSGIIQEHRSHLGVISDMTGNGSDIGAASEGVNAIIEELASAIEREQALAAHVEAIKAAGDSANWDEDRLGAMLGVLDETPATSLARRDLIKQAEALEEEAECLSDIYSQDWLLESANDKRQRAQ